MHKTRKRGKRPRIVQKWACSDLRVWEDPLVLIASYTPQE